MIRTSPSLSFPVQGDKENSSFFNEYHRVLLEELDALGLSGMIHEIDAIRGQGNSFLLGVVSSKDEGLKQVFSSASEHSSLIIEYVQRFGGFQGFFTKDNVAQLTHAAGIEEALLLMQSQAQEITHV